MNYEKSGNLIASIKSNKDDKKNINIYNDYDNKENLKSYFEELELNDKDDYFQIMPQKDHRIIGWVTGSSGSGKSYFTRQFINEYHRINPRNNIYIFSSLQEDETLDKLKYIKRINLNSDKFLNIQLDIKDFKDTLIIADDTDVIKNKYVRAKVYDILDQILEIGRHTNTSLIMTNHLATNGSDSRRAINESHFVTVFPQTISSKAKKYLLGDYIGLSNEQLKKLNTIKSRAITILRSYPKILIAEKNIYTLNNIF
jgi:hypothetical protein